MGPSILLSGMVAGTPHQGGATWAVLQYLLGLRRLGADVCLVEPIDEAQLRPQGAGLAQSESAAYFKALVRSFGLGDCAALWLRGTTQTVGLPYERMRERAWRADALLNIAGMLDDPALRERIPIQAYLDLDPAFTQLWQVQGIDMRFGGHTHFVTIGLRVGEPGCVVPTCGLDWIATRQPVVLGYWTACAAPVPPALTTIANWRSYGSVEHNGVHYGQKAHALRPLFPAAARAAVAFELALAIDPAETQDLERLNACGWRLLDPVKIAGTPGRYRRFVQRSWAELGVAKSGYIASRCGWFSDRSLCYLASGRPVLAQETGFRELIGADEGLLGFTTVDELLAGVDELQRNYQRHARAARSLAEEFFDSDRVLPQLLARIGL